MEQFSNLKKHNQRFEIIQCIAVFTILFTTVLCFTVAANHYSQVVFQCMLLFTGWFAWTFFEYISHRFLMHHKNRERPLVDFNHKHHHSHPTEIQITPLHRGMLIVGSTALIALSIWLNNYFTLVAGFLCGFPAYTIMHYLLHQKNMQPFLRKMIQYHISHHCKHPDKCFGISVTWWDDMLGTTPAEGETVPQRIIDFYFKQETHIT